MKYLLNIGLILFFSNITISQSQINEIDEQIKTYNQQLAKAIEEDMEFIFPHLKTICPLNLPAIGPVDHNIDIYFDLVQKVSEMGEEEILHDANIHKVTFKVESGSYKFDYTFHFDAAGTLIFHSERKEQAGYDCTLTSYYFDNKACVLMRSELIATNFCEVTEENQPQEKTVLTSKDKSAVSRIMDSSSKFKKLLALYVAILLD